MLLKIRPCKIFKFPWNCIELTEYTNSWEVNFSDNKNSYLFNIFWYWDNVMHFWPTSFTKQFLYYITHTKKMRHFLYKLETGNTHDTWHHHPKQVLNSGQLLLQFFCFLKFKTWRYEHSDHILKASANFVQ